MYEASYSYHFLNNKPFMCLPSATDQKTNQRQGNAKLLKLKQFSKAYKSVVRSSINIQTKSPPEQNFIQNSQVFAQLCKI